MDRYSHGGDLFLGIALTIGGLVCVAIAYTPLVELLFIEFIAQGIAETFINIGTSIRNRRFWTR